MAESTERTLRFDPPRPMTEREAEILALMLEGTDPVLEPLRAQAAIATVRSMCGCGCATIDFELAGHEALPAAPIARFQRNASRRASRDAREPVVTGPRTAAPLPRTPALIANCIRIARHAQMSRTQPPVSVPEPCAERSILMQLAITGRAATEARDLEVRASPF